MKILDELIKKLEIDYKRQLERLPTDEEMKKCSEFQKRHNMMEAKYTSIQRHGIIKQF